MIQRFRVKRLWFILILLCFIVGVISLIPSGAEGDGALLPYQSIIPLAPISSILIWLLGFSFYLLGRWATDKPIRRPYQ
ncbi:MAG TPA: hypothetical protein G4O13_02835 [Dehalococcoidia bacterium]|nr:hypothetical protein [Dehalococcoidia bacterium]